MGVAEDVDMHRFVAWALLAAGCGGPLSEGQGEFEKGHYAQAAQSLAAIEAGSRAWAPAERAEYALYRGLACGALGDVARARAWLGRAKAREDAHPGSLAPDDARRLRLAIDTYEVR